MDLRLSRGAAEDPLTVRRAMLAVSIVFFLKAGLLGLFVTPLWDVPDEPGHFAYLQDIAKGRGLPVPGRSVIPADIVANWMRDPAARPVANWVAIHPPLAHLAAVPFLDAAEVLTEDRETLYRAPRLASATWGAIALFVFYLVFLEASGDAPASFFAASAVGFVPMFTHLSSGMGNDIPVALAGGFAALYWVRLVRSGQFADGVKMGAALALAGATKLTALPLTLALLALSFRRLSSRGWRRAAEWAAIALVSLSLPVVWAGRSWWRIKYSAAWSARAVAAPEGFLDFLREYPVVDHTFKNFFGLIGWTGTGQGRLDWFQISGPFLLPYLLLSLGLLAGTAVAWVRIDPHLSSRLVAYSAVVALATFALGFWFLFSTLTGVGLLKRLTYSLLLAVPTFSLSAPLETRNFPHFVQRGALFSFLVLGIVYLLNSFQAFKFAGGLSATHGRYLFVGIPFLLLAFALPVVTSFRGSRREIIAFAVVAVLFLNETAFFLLRVIPFYSGAWRPSSGR